MAIPPKPTHLPKQKQPKTDASKGFIQRPAAPSTSAASSSSASYTGGHATYQPHRQNQGLYPTQPISVHSANNVSSPLASFPPPAGGMPPNPLHHQHPPLPYPPPLGLPTTSGFHSHANAALQTYTSGQNPRAFSSNPVHVASRAHLPPPPPSLSVQPQAPLHPSLPPIPQPLSSSVSSSSHIRRRDDAGDVPEPSKRVKPNPIPLSDLIKSRPSHLPPPPATHGLPPHSAQALPAPPVWAKHSLPARVTHTLPTIPTAASSVLDGPRSGAVPQSKKRKLDSVTDVPKDRSNPTRTGSAGGGNVASNPAAPPLRVLRNPADAPELSLEQAPGLLLSYITSLHRPAIKKRHPAAIYEYTPIQDDPAVDPPRVKCTITLPVESQVINHSASAVGLKAEAKQNVSRQLMLEAWRCGEVNDHFEPVLDPAEEARLAAATASNTPGSTAVPLKLAEFWKECINDDSKQLFPVLITFPPVPTPTPPKPREQMDLKNPPSEPRVAEIGCGSLTKKGTNAWWSGKLEKVREKATRKDVRRLRAAEEEQQLERKQTDQGKQPEDAEDPDSDEDESPLIYTPRPIFLLTRRPLPSMSTLPLFVEHQPIEITLTHYDAIPLSSSDDDAIQAFTLRMIRAITNRPMVIEPGKRQPAYYIAPVADDWLEKHADDHEKASKHDPTVLHENSLAPAPNPLASVQDMIDWDEVRRTIDGPPVTSWTPDDVETLEKECKDAMACGKNEFSRRFAVQAFRKDLSPHSSPADSLVSIGSIFTQIIARPRPLVSYQFVFVRSLATVVILKVRSPASASLRSFQPFVFHIDLTSFAAPRERQRIRPSSISSSRPRAPTSA